MRIWSPAVHQMGMLARAIELHAAPCLLVLDEVDRLPRRTVQLINLLLTRAPANLHLAMAFRSDPGLDLATHVLAGEAIVVGVRQCRFSTADIARFFHGKLSRRELATVVEVTAGWPVALLVYRNMRAHEAKGLGADAERLTENYVGVRLLRDLSATDRACLLDLAVFDWLDDDLVDEVLGTSDARVRISPEQRRSRDERAGRHDLDREILNHAPPSSPAAASGSTGTDVESTTRGIRRRPALQLLTRMSRTTERTVVVSFAAVLLLLRSSALVFGESSPFDSDQAIFGLMAKHVSEMRAFSAFGYGQSHILAVEAWLAAPLFYVFGPSVTALKLPILGINLAVVLIFLFRLERDVGLRPVMALVPTLFLIMEPLGTAVHLHQAAGGNVEPFLYVLLIWLVRRRPLLLGAILAFGFLNREFTAYGLAALLLLETLDGSLLTRRGLQDKLLAAVSAVSVFGVIDALESIGNPAGPGTTAATAAYASQMQFFLGRSCWALSGIPTWLAQMFGPHLETLYADGTPGGSRWLWLTLGATTVGALARVAVLAYPVVRKNWHRWQFPIYIALVGLAAALVPAVARCGAVIERYVLLALFLIPGIIALYLAVERNTKLRTIIVSVVLLWAAANTVDYVRYARDRYGSPPDSRQVLADYLVSNGIRFAIGDYWTAYNVTFRSREKVIMASSDFIRIRQYQDIVSRRRSDAVRVTRRPCEGGQEVAGYHVCPQGE